MRNFLKGRKAIVAIPLSLAALLGTGAAAGAIGSSGSSFGIPGLGSLSDYLRDQNNQQQTPLRTDDSVHIDGLPAGVSVDHVDWLTDRRIAVYIKSAAMPDQLMQVQILLARDWFSQPDKTFPEVWALDGLRATDIENGWTAFTNIASFYADKNVNVILPVGGEASFYTDWNQPDNGKNYKWETFLTQELPAVLTNGFRSNGTRAIYGISMGGTAAFNLAEHHPDMFNFVGSFSGYLDTTSPGMPQGIAYALQDAGGYNAQAMWGEYGSQRWIDNDPKRGVDRLKGKTLYVSSGNGEDDYGQPGSVATGPSNVAGMGLEFASRMTAQNFVSAAEAAGVPVITQFRPSGVHNWPYWQFEMQSSWENQAQALGLSQEDSGAACTASGDIGTATANGEFGSCVNNEYDMSTGKAQDFTGGRAYWSQYTGAHVLIGRIGARYSEMGGATSWLGFPTSNEMTTPDGQGRYVTFEHGAIYWSPNTGAWAIPEDLFQAWGEKGYEGGVLGYPIAESKEVNGTYVQQFQNGYVVRNGNRAWVVQGIIAQRYGAMDTANSQLGKPTGDEVAINGGVYQNFENGIFYWSAETGAHFLKFGSLFDEWARRGYEAGSLGWPTSDQTALPGAGEHVDFQHGGLTLIGNTVVDS
ncbi:MAG: alpha/beta hydrolase-fold protein [Corynebacterium sp.]|nr:alpha/beta hydrolase-fold protein [Corynebacterium sp.]